MKTYLKAALIAPVLLAAALAPGAPLADRLPGETLLYVGWAGRTLTFDGSMVGQLLQEPEVGQLVRLVQHLLRDSAGSRFPAQQAEHMWSLAKIVWQRPVAIGVLPFEAKSPRAAMLIDVGDDREPFEAELSTALNELAGEAEIAERTVGTTTFRTITGPGGMVFSFGYMDNVFFACVGDGVAEALIELVPGGSLAADEGFSSCLDAVTGENEQLVFYLDVPAAVETAENVVPPPSSNPQTAPAAEAPSGVTAVLKALGLGKAAALAGTTRIVDRGMYTKVRVFSPAPHEGLLMPFAGPPLTDADLARVPEDAVYLAAANISAKGFVEQVIRIGQLLPAPWTRSLSPLLDALASVDDTTLASFGDTWVLSSCPSHGGLFTGTVITAEVQDPNAFAEMLADLERPFRPAPPGEPTTAPSETQPSATRPADLPTIHSAPAGRTEVHYLTVGGDGQAAFFQPAWAIQKNRLYLAGWPQVIQTAIQQEVPRPLTAGEPYQNVRSKLTGEPSVLIYQDEGRVLRALYPFLLPIAARGRSRVAARQDIPPIPLLPPSLAKVNKYVWPHITAGRGDAEGVTIETYGSGIHFYTQLLFPASLVPSLMRAREGAKISISSRRLDAIGEAASDYAAAYQSPAPDLAALCERHLLHPDVLVSPLSGRPAPVLQDGRLVGEVDYIYIRLPLDAPIDLVQAHERPGNYPRRDGTNVLYKDRSVRFVDSQTFQRELRRTREWMTAHDEQGGVTTTQIAP